jgi:thiamine kinase-like enzyme
MHEEVSIPELTEVVARLSALLGPRQGGVLLLEGGITNRNYRVNFGGTPYVVRLPGKDTELLGIDREGERLATRAAAELKLGPKLAAMLDEPPCLVTCFVESREVTAAELREPARIDEVARGLRAFHESGLDLPTQFAVPRVAAGYAEASRARGGEVPASFDDALDIANRIAKAVEGHPEHQPHPCHDDLLAANFLHDGERLMIVDWEYAGMGDRFFDLGNFAVNNELDEAGDERLLEAYLGEPATGRRRAALKLYRYMSDLREAMWGVVQTSVSELPFDFGDYADRHFKRLQAAGADERFGGWLEEAGGP